MMKLRTKTFWPLLLCILFSPFIQGQPVSHDSLSPETAPPYVEALQQYHGYLSPETALFRGPEYVAYDRLLKSGQPYYGENKKRPGTVYYHGIYYAPVDLLYDIVSDQVILSDSYNVFKIALIGEYIDSFTIQDHFFLRLRDSLNHTAPRNGFYERLYNGHIILLKKEKKTILEDLYSSNVVQRYIEGTDSSYYLKIGNDYHSVSTSKSLFNTLKDKKKELKKFIRSNQLSMRKDRENTLIKVTAWYDSQAH